VGKSLSLAILIGMNGVAALLPLNAHGDGVLASCVDIADAAARLACYDRIAGRVSTTPVPAAVDPGTNSVPPAPPAAAVATTRPPADKDPVAEFGLSQQVLKQRDPEGWMDSIAGTVRGVTQNTSGRYVVELDNGQVWAQSETNSYPVLKAGDSVNIRRGAVGSFVLTGPRSVSWRVRRLR
jgi:hypothetical protein